MYYNYTQRKATSKRPLQAHTHSFMQTHVDASFWYLYSLSVTVSVVKAFAFLFLICSRSLSLPLSFGKGNMFNVAVHHYCRVLVGKNGHYFCHGLICTFSSCRALRVLTFHLHVCCAELLFTIFKWKDCFKWEAWQHENNMQISCKGIIFTCELEDEHCVWVNTADYFYLAVTVTPTVYIKLACFSFSSF